jgi:hypothetical protein
MLMSSARRVSLALEKTALNCPASAGFVVTQNCESNFWGWAAETELDCVTLIVAVDTKQHFLPGLQSEAT